MEKEKSKFIREVVVFCATYLAFIGLKALGILQQPWRSVLSFPFWYVFVSFCCSLAFLAAIGAVTAVKAVNHRKKVDRRVIRQAKAAGVWDKPQYLGGRALELRAWEDFKIKRLPGETDTALRRRCGKIEIVKQIAKEHGRKIKKIKADGHNIQITLCDETPPREGGHSNEQS